MPLGSKQIHMRHTTRRRRSGPRSDVIVCTCFGYSQAFCTLKHSFSILKPNESDISNYIVISTLK